MAGCFAKTGVRSFGLQPSNHATTLAWSAFRMTALTWVQDAQSTAAIGIGSLSAVASRFTLRFLRMSMRNKAIHRCLGAILAGTLACSSDHEKLEEIATRLDSLSRRVERIDRAQPAPPTASPEAASQNSQPSVNDSTNLQPSQNPVSDRALDPGFLLDVWLWDGEGDLKLLTRDRSLGSTIARGEYFRFNQVNTDEALRSYWGRPMILKWSGYLKIEEDGAYSFAFELSKDYTGQFWTTGVKVQTIAEIGGVTMFEKTVEVTDNQRIFEPEARVLRLHPGYYTVAVWLAVHHEHLSSWSLPPSTQLGTFIKVRTPSARTPVAIQPGQVWHDR